MAEVVIVGPGAMGCLHAALLWRSGVDVALLDYRPERARRLAARGIELRWPDGSVLAAQVPITARADELAEAAFIVVMVKAYSTGAAARHAAEAAGRGTVWVTLQNGLGNVEQIRTVDPSARVLAGVTTSGANMAGEGQVNVAGVGRTTVGPAAGTTVEHARAFAELWGQGVEVEAVEDPRPAIWRKLVVNAAINPLGAITGMPNGRLIEVPQLRALAFALAREVASVAAANGIDLGPDFDPAAAVEAVAQATATNRCSMLQDVEAGRRTEIDWINGAVARLAAADAPAVVNEAAAAMVKAIEQAQRRDRQE